MSTTPTTADDARAAALSSLLRDHPGALVSAIDAGGLFVELPASIELAGQHVVEASSALALVDSSSRTAVIDAWDLAKSTGTSSTPVVLKNGIEATYHFLDLRQQHGVLFGAIVATSDVELRTAFAERPLVMPKTGRIDKDEMAVIRFADDRICLILGYEVDEIVGTRSLELLHPDDRDAAIDAWMDMLGAPGATSRVRARHRRKDGSWVWLELTNRNLLSAPEGRVVTEMIDVSDEMAALESLRQREQLLARLAEALPSGILQFDRERRVVHANTRLQHIVGIGPSPTVEAQLTTVIPEDRIALSAALDAVLLEGRDVDLEVRLRLPGESSIRRCAVATRVLTAADGTIGGAVLCIDDITESFELRTALERRATVDELTGCLNRAAVLEFLDELLRHGDDAPAGTAVAFLDLDGFKEVNDTFGHEAGDRLLAAAAARLRSALRPGDAIGRLGGDEFLVVLAGVPDRAAAMELGRRLAEALVEPLPIVDGMPVHVRSSIGIAWAASGTLDGDGLTAAADRAMYESKRQGRGVPIAALDSATEID